MPPKKEGVKKKKKATRPPHIPEALWELSQNLPKLQEFWSGEIKESKGKSADKPVPNISRTQAGLFMVQLLYPNSKAAKEKREECIKLGVVETCVKVMSSQKAEDMVSAAGILTVLIATYDQCRQIMLDSKPAIAPQLLTGFSSHESAPLRAALCGLMRAIVMKDDSRPRLWRQLREWDWTPLVACLRLQDVSQLGGRNAAHDLLAALELLCCAPAGDAGTIACNHIVASGGLQAIVEVLRDRVSHPMARAAGVSILNQIMRRAPAPLCEEVMITLGGLLPIVSLLEHPIVPLLYKAHTAAVLLRFILPDSLWKDSSALAGHHARTRPTTAASLAASLAGATLNGQTSPGLPPPTTSIADHSQQAPAPAVASDHAPSASATVANGSVSAQAGSIATTTGAHGGSVPRPSTASMGRASDALDPPLPDEQLMDDATKADIIKRARLVAQSGAIPPLVRLCLGPDGPLPDLEAAAQQGSGTDGQSDAAVDPKTGKKPAKKKKKKKKKGKLLPGMAEALTWSSAVLRMISLDAEWREKVCEASAIRYLLPLLDSRIHPARWNARQTLVNLSMTPSLMPSLQLYQVPDYIHGGNIPQRHFERPFPSTGIVEAGLAQVPEHLAGARKDMQSAGSRPGGPNFAGGAARPPALKPRS